MIQIVAHTPAQALAAVNAGCAWVHYTDPSTLDELLPALADSDVIVTIPGSYAADKDTRVHGVILAPEDMRPADAREHLGPNAIIGVEASGIVEIINAAGADVDVFIVDAPLDDLRQIVEMARAKGVGQRIIARSSDPAGLRCGADALQTEDLTLLSLSGQ